MKKFGTKSIKLCGCGKSTCDICGWEHFKVIRDNDTKPIYFKFLSDTCGNFITVPDTNDWNLSDGDFTIDGYFYIEPITLLDNQFLRNRFLIRR